MSFKCDCTVLRDAKIAKGSRVFVSSQLHMVELENILFYKPMFLEVTIIKLELTLQQNNTFRHWRFQIRQL